MTNGGLEWTEYVPDPRDQLVHDVLHGRRTPADAEAEAQRLGIGPLAAKPDPMIFDPAMEPFWSIPMAVVWIALRDFDAVRCCWDSYRAKRWNWKPTSRNLWPELPENSMTLDIEGPATLLTAEVIIAHLGKFTGDVDAAWKMLVDQLRLGNLSVQAIDIDTERSVVVPPIEWKILNPDRYSDAFAVRGGGRYYRAVEVSRKELISYWPVIPTVESEAQDVPGWTARSESLSIEAGRTFLSKNPDATKAATRAYLHEQFRQMPFRAFDDRIWPKAREKAGLPPRGRSGRPKKTPQ